MLLGFKANDSHRVLLGFKANDSLPVACAVSPRGPCRELCSFALGGSRSIWLPRPCQCLCGVDLRSCSVLSLSFPPGTEGRLPSPAPLAPPPRLGVGA